MDTKIGLVKYKHKYIIPLPFNLKKVGACMGGELISKISTHLCPHLTSEFGSSSKQTLYTRDLVFINQ